MEMGTFSCPVQKPDTQIQIGGKGHPEEIGDLQKGRAFIHFPERQDHQNDEYPQDKQPEKGQTEGLKIEKQNAPQEIECQLSEKQQHGLGTGIGGGGGINSCRTNAHQREKDGPNDGKQPYRRR